MRLLLSDFGQADNEREKVSGQNGKITIGTLGYNAPEVEESAKNGQLFDSSKA